MENRATRRPHRQRHALTRTASIAPSRSFGRNGFCRQTDVGKSRGFRHEVERRHSGYRDDRQIRISFAHLHDQIDAVGALQEDIDDREVELGFFERLQSGRGAFGFDDLEMIDPQHDANHRAHIGLVVDHKNTGHEVAPGPAWASLRQNRGSGATRGALFGLTVKTPLLRPRAFGRINQAICNLRVDGH